MLKWSIKAECSSSPDESWLWTQERLSDWILLWSSGLAEALKRPQRGMCLASHWTRAGLLMDLWIRFTVNALDSLQIHCSVASTRSASSVTGESVRSIWMLTDVISDSWRSEQSHTQREIRTMILCSDAQLSPLNPSWANLVRIAVLHVENVFVFLDK